MAVFTAASLKESTREILLKAVNTSGTSLPTNIVLNGVTAVAPTAQQTVLTSAALTDENSFTTPTKIVPVAGTLSTPGTQFPVTLAPYSVTILRLQATPAATAQNVSTAPGNGQVALSWTPCPVRSVIPSNAVHVGGRTVHDGRRWDHLDPIYGYDRV